MTIFQYFEANEGARSSKITHTIMNVFAYVFALSSVPFFFTEKNDCYVYVSLFQYSCWTFLLSSLDFCDA